MDSRYETIYYDQLHHTISISGNTLNFTISNNLAFNNSGSTPQCIKLVGNNTFLFTATNQFWGVNPLFVYSCGTSVKPGYLSVDGVVDIYDYNFLVGNFGRTS